MNLQMRLLSIFLACCLNGAAVASEGGFRKGEHPRLYFSGADLPALRKQAQSGVRGEILKQLVTWCEKFLDPKDSEYFDFRERRRPIWKEREARMIWEPAVHMLSFAHAFTGDKRYGETARDAIMNAIETRLSDMRCRSLNTDYLGWRRGPIHQHDKGMHAWAVCHAYDLCHDGFTEAQRARVRDYIFESIRIADEPEVLRVDTQAKTNNRGMRAFVGVRGFYHLLLEEDVDMPRRDIYLTQALSAADAYLHSAFDQDGVCYEGASYANSASFVYAFARAMERSGRPGLLRQPFWEKYLASQLYELIPSGGKLNNLNDCDEMCGSVQPGMFLMNTGKGAVVPWLARNLDLHPWRREQVKADPINSLFNLMLPMWLWEWREDLPVRHPRDLGYPLSHLFPQRGIASMRTGWDQGDLLLSHKCGLEPFGQHRQSDQNHVALYALGENFLVDEGYGRPDAKDEKGKAAPPRYYSRANVHNLVLVDGKEPNPLLPLGSVAGGRIVDWLHRSQFDTSLGDATANFTMDMAVERALRRVVLVRDTPHPFAIVIDEVIVDGSGRPHDFQVLWRTAKGNRITVEGREFVIAGVKNDCRGRVLYPADGVRMPVSVHFGKDQLRATHRAATLEMVTVFVPVKRGEKGPEFTCQRQGAGMFIIHVRDGEAKHVIQAGTRREGPLATPAETVVKRE